MVKAKIIKFCVSWAIAFAVVYAAASAYLAWENPWAAAGPSSTSILKVLPASGTGCGADCE